MIKKVGLISIIASSMLSGVLMADANITQVATGYNHVVALEANGTIWGWGDNTYGQVGDGSTSNLLYPKELNTTTATGFSTDLNISKIVAGKYYTLALEANGTLWAWGVNNNYQLGDGTDTNRTNPVQVHTTISSGFSTDLNISKISAGISHIVLLEENGSVWAWGNNENGQLGDGTDTNRSTPVEVNISTKTGFSVDLNITQVSAGTNHTVALEANGSVWAWGKNDQGQLGDTSDTNSSSSVPVEVNTTTVTGFAVYKNGSWIPTDLNITQVWAGDDCTFALEANGSVWSWGDGANFKRGIWSFSDTNYPVEVNTTATATFEVNSVPTDLNITKVKGAKNTGVALEANGTLWAWGFASKGMGDRLGAAGYFPYPLELNTTTSRGWYYDTNITDMYLTSGESFFAIDSNGTLLGWGNGGNGEMGNGGTASLNKVPKIIGTEARFLSVTSNTSKQIGWRSPFYTVSSYDIYRSSDSGSSYTKIESNVSGSSTSYNDSSADYNTNYKYILTSKYTQFGTFTETNCSAADINFTITTPAITTPTSNATSIGTVESSKTTITTNINWSHSGLTNVTNTKVYYKKSSDNSYTTASSVTTNSTTYSLSSLTPGTLYKVIVAEGNSSIAELNSSEVSFTTTHTPPYNLSATGTTTNSTTLSWSDGSLTTIARRRNQPTPTYYRIYKDGVKLTEGLSSTSYTVTGLNPSTTYNFMVSEYGTVVNRRRDVSQESEYNSTAISVTTLTPVVEQPTSLITSNTDSTTKDDQKVKQEEKIDSYVNSADLTTPDGKGTKVVLETPKEGSDVTSKTLTLEYTDTDTAKTTLTTDKDVDVTVNIDGSFVATKSFEDKKVTANGDSKGDTSIDIENAHSKQNINVPKGADVKIENNIAKATHTIKAETKQNISDMSIKIEADPTKSVTVTANYTNNGKEESTTYTTPSDVIEANVDFIPANENGVYSGITAIIKTTNNLSFNENQRSLRTTTTLDPNTTTIVGTSAWQKYDERVYFDGRRTVTLLLGSANILRDGKEETMIKGVEYELVPSTNADTTTNSDLVASENTLTQIYTNSYLNIREGWNLISNPTSEPLNIEGAFKYATSSFKYQNGWIHNPKEVNQNEGIWINYPKHVSEKIVGDSYYSDFTNATSSWNLFGAGRDIDLNELNSFNEVWAYDSKVKSWIKNPSIIYRGYGFWVK